MDFFDFLYRVNENPTKPNLTNLKKVGFSSYQFVAFLKRTVVEKFR
jgi:hypothetical protein